MTIHIPSVWLITGLVLIGLITANAQTSLTLTYGNPATSPDSAFSGNVFQAGSEIGDAYFFVKFGGTGTRYFEIDSPGESTTKKVSSDGYVSIRPVANITIDQSKIKAFTGPVSGSIVVTVKPLSITTINTSVVTDVVPGSEINIYYRTGAGTFPAALVNQKFGLQLLDANGVLIAQLLNASDQYSGREQAKASNGDIRIIKATIPPTTASGSYRVRVVTQGLITNVLGSASSLFTVKATAPVTPTILAGSITGSACPGGIVSFPFSTTGTFSVGNAFKVQLIDATGVVTQDLPGLSSSSPISTTLPASLTAGTYRFQIAATATSVQSNTSSLSVLAAPTMTISGSSTVTAGTTAPVRLTFTGTPPWSFTYIDNATIRTAISSINSTTITPTFLSSTLFDKSFIKVFTDSGCGLSSAISGSAQITVGQLTIATGTLSGTFCPGTTVPVSFTTSSSLPADVIYQVQLSDGTGSFLNAQTIGSGTTSPLMGQLPVTLVVTSGYRIQVVIQKPTTSGSVDYSSLASPISSPLLVSRPDLPKVINLTICSGINTTPLSATGVNLKWYTTSTSPQSLTSAPAPSNSQSNTYYVSQTVNGCESARQPLSVSVVAAPSAPAVSSVSLCQGAQAQFSTPIPNPLWYTSEMGGTGSSQPPMLNSQMAGDQTFYVSQTVNGCESARATVKATVYPTPAAPTFSSLLPICQFSPASSLTATGTSLTWYSQSGRLSSAPMPNTSLAGIQSYSVTQTINTCESSRATISVTILSAPTSPVAIAARYCVGESPRSLTATGSNLKWYTAISGGVASSTSPNFSTDLANIFTFYVSQTDASGCESARQPLSVSVVATPSAPAISSVSVCQGGQAQFSIPIPNPLWYSSLMGGTGSPQPPTLNSQTAGEQTFYVSQTVNSCESARATVKATVYPIPAAPTIPASVPLCQFTTASPLTATGTSLVWYGQSGRLPGAPTPNTSLAGTQSYSVSQTVNTCESSRTTVRVVVRSASPNPTANSVRYCIGDVPRSLTANGSNLKWYTTSSGGTGSSTSPAFFTETATTLTFFVTQTDTSGCESVRQPVSVSVVSPPSAPTVTASQIVCQSSKVGPLTASPNTGLVWQGPGITGSSEIAPVPTTTQPGTFTYVVVQKAGSCTSQAAQIFFTVAPTPAAPQVQTPTIFCVGTTTTPLSATGSSLTWYTSADHSGPSLAQIRPDISRVSVTTYYVTQKSSNNCESPNSIIEVRVSQKATARISGDGDIYPGDSTAIRVRLTGEAPWTFTDWTSKLITITNPKDSLYVAWVRPTSTTTYAIKNLMTTCGQGDSGAPYVLRVNTPLSTQPTLEPLLITIYPNPTSGHVSVNLSSPTKQTVTLQIINTTGTVIRQVTRTSASTPQIELFMLDDQPAGLYFLQVKTPTNGIQVKPILKQ